ncbi:hypothetical protein [Jiella sp. M17.18]|uniref:hypothetical protein n=1 Tax=Jiella sp. M17.18 TaxID=3234247 RepID=UPI0034DFA68E
MTREDRSAVDPDRPSSVSLPKPQFKWQRFGVGQRFLGYDGRLHFGTIAFTEYGMHRGEWEWSVCGMSWRDHGPHRHGFRLNHPRVVAVDVERLYLRLLPLCDGVQLRVEDEIAHFEARGLPLPRGTAWRKARFFGAAEAPIGAG